MTPTRLSRLAQRTRNRLTDPAHRPLPRITTRTGPTLPGWTLRLALAALTPVLLLAAASRTPGLSPGLVLTVTALATTLLALRPTPAAAGAVTVLAAVLLWGFQTEPLDPWTLPITALAYLLTRLTWWAAHLPPRGHAEITALLAGWRRDLAVLTATTALGALALLTTGTTHPLAVLLAALAVAGTAVLALATGRAPRDDGPTGPDA
ncbi:hypothetical protein ACFQHV_02155 [Promicromonospora thailandica]|uniref:Uncharacterized protein n=1 Tax=Promicromonospora thailandica TaxID=765201 RepID=A0A9X2G1H6_9MICO|nr:hypothetical protein [Promicromonospora thailandica]MCP2265342.1 hypothetical protein [Promicromonospora thailandica]BFF16875.1 hypothetical protein GCM10025730_03960 [Promicromonospora thailandica]